MRKEIFFLFERFDDGIASDKQTFSIRAHGSNVKIHFPRVQELAIHRHDLYHFTIVSIIYNKDFFVNYNHNEIACFFH